MLLGPYFFLFAIGADNPPHIFLKKIRLHVFCFVQISAIIAAENQGNIF